MKSQYVSELKPGQIVKDKFILSKKIIKEKKDGGSYTLLELSDRTGSIEGIAWDSISEDLKTLSLGDFIFVEGNVNEYNERLEVVVTSVSKIADDEIMPEDFLPKCDEDINQVMLEIDRFVAMVHSPHLKKILELFFTDKNFLEKFRTAPGAKKAHHAYIGGLAIHTRNVLRFIMGIRGVYESVNLELLITAGLLHDIGKIFEYTYQKKLDLSTKGKMLGHIIIGYEMVMGKIEKIPNFPEDLKLRLLHMVLSHHGELQWGSPAQPVFPEALVLHFIDNLDSKLAMMIEALKKHTGSEREWSDYHPYLEREIYLRKENS